MSKLFSLKFLIAICFFLLSFFFIASSYYFHWNPFFAGKLSKTSARSISLYSNEFQQYLLEQADSYLAFFENNAKYSKIIDQSRQTVYNGFLQFDINLNQEKIHQFFLKHQISTNNETSLSNPSSQKPFKLPDKASLIQNNYCYSKCIQLIQTIEQEQDLVAINNAVSFLNSLNQSNTGNNSNLETLYIYYEDVFSKTDGTKQTAFFRNPLNNICLYDSNKMSSPEIKSFIDLRHSSLCYFSLTLGLFFSFLSFGPTGSLNILFVCQDYSEWLFRLTEVMKRFHFFMIFVNNRFLLQTLEDFFPVNRNHWVFSTNHFLL